MTDKRNWIEGLKEIKEVFDQVKLKYWLDLGTLLGAVREGKMIDWDDDFDVSTTIEEAHKVLSVIPLLASRGWKIEVTDFAVYFSKPEDNLAIGLGFYQREGDKIWILFTNKKSKFEFILKHLYRISDRILYKDFHKRINFLERVVYALIPHFSIPTLRQWFFGICHLLGQEDYALVLPSTLIQNLKMINFYGMEFGIPNHPEDYLSLVYGKNWRVPNQNWLWSHKSKTLDSQFLKNKKRAKYSLFF